MAQLYIPDPPKEWKMMEERMEAALSPHRCLVQDDHDRAKVWSVKPSELVYSVLSNIALDPAWKILPTVDVQVLEPLDTLKVFLDYPPSSRPGKARSQELVFQTCSCLSSRSATQTTGPIRA